jgi:hypothetical protein
VLRRPRFGSRTADQTRRRDAAVVGATGQVKQLEEPLNDTYELGTAHFEETV